MYGAYWCSHCYEQKQLFGKEAVKEVNYLECALDGKNSQTALCQKANIKGFPTWEIKGQQYSGTQSLERLTELTGYQGSKQFRYKLPGQ